MLILFVEAQTTFVTLPNSTMNIVYHEKGAFVKRVSIAAIYDKNDAKVFIMKMEGS